MKRVREIFLKVINWLVAWFRLDTPAVKPVAPTPKASKTVYKDSKTKKVVDFKKSRANITGKKPKK